METHPPVDLSRFDNSWYCPGRSSLLRILWFLIGQPLLRCSILPSSSFRVRLLRFFGASIGQAVVIKPGVRVKYPWLLEIGDYSWIGEDVWIDNLAAVRIGSHVCVSQGAYLCTGSHDWADPRFSLIVKAIALHDCSWVAAKSVLCPGVVLGKGAVAAAGSVVTKNIPAWEIHAGNPAIFVRSRVVAPASS